MPEQTADVDHLAKIEAALESDGLADQPWMADCMWLVSLVRGMRMKDADQSGRFKAMVDQRTELESEVEMLRARLPKRGRDSVSALLGTYEKRNRDLRRENHRLVTRLAELGVHDTK